MLYRVKYINVIFIIYIKINTYIYGNIQKYIVKIVFDVLDEIDHILQYER